jgi:molecular chaperone GrpE
MSHKSKHAPTPDTKEPIEPEGNVSPDPDNPPPADPAEKTEPLDTELEVARREAAEHLDKFLRAKAEVENIRRRAEIDGANARKYALERFAGELLAVRDSLELARNVDLQSDNADAVNKMREGLALTLKLMDDIFTKFSLVQIDPQNEKFDPDRHQAISVVETDEVESNRIVTVVQKGYMLHDRVLRPAMVMVSRAKAIPEDKGQAGGSEPPPG